MVDKSVVGAHETRRRVAGIGTGVDGREEHADTVVALGRDDVIDATLVLDTSAYADGDVLSVVAELASFYPNPAGSRLLESLIVIDEDDQGVGFDLLFSTRRPRSARSTRRRAFRTRMPVRSSAKSASWRPTTLILVVIASLACRASTKCSRLRRG